MILTEAIEKIEKIVTPKKVTMINYTDETGYKFNFELNFDKKNRSIDFEYPHDKILNCLKNYSDCGATYRDIKNETKLDNKVLRRVLNYLVGVGDVMKLSENKKGVWCFYFEN